MTLQKVWPRGPRRLHFWEPKGPKVTPTTIMWYSLVNCHRTMENHHQHAIFMAKSTISMGMVSMSPSPSPKISRKMLGPHDEGHGTGGNPRGLWRI